MIFKLCRRIVSILPAVTVALVGLGIVMLALGIDIALLWKYGWVYVGASLIIGAVPFGEDLWKEYRSDRSDD